MAFGRRCERYVHGRQSCRNPWRRFQASHSPFWQIPRVYDGMVTCSLPEGLVLLVVGIFNSQGAHARGAGKVSGHAIGHGSSYAV